VRAAGAAPGRVDAALAALLDAVIARRDGDDGLVRTRGLDAASGFADIGWPLLAARCRELVGDVAGALAAYRRCEAFGDVRRLERPVLANGAPPTRGVLTPRERDVAALVAAGKPNQVVAEALAISRKAVEKYLTSIYEKLGVTSRAQLAVYIVSADRTQAPR
jgi:DNA-binding CsgD family transcriptional regulator